MKNTWMNETSRRYFCVFFLFHFVKSLKQHDKTSTWNMTRVTLNNFYYSSFPFFILNVNDWVYYITQIYVWYSFNPLVDIIDDLNKNLKILAINGVRFFFLEFMFFLCLLRKILMYLDAIITHNYLLLYFVYDKYRCLFLSHPKMW